LRVKASFSEASACCASRLSDSISDLVKGPGLADRGRFAFSRLGDAEAEFLLEILLEGIAKSLPQVLLGGGVERHPRTVLAAGQRSRADRPAAAGFNVASQACQGAPSATASSTISQSPGSTLPSNAGWKARRWKAPAPPRTR